MHGYSLNVYNVYIDRKQYDSSQGIMNMNFVQFATTYKVVNGELTKLPENITPKIFPINQNFMIFLCIIMVVEISFSGVVLARRYAGCISR